ncbi:MAG: hypothetical protein KDA37_05700, partial [Planctomycetales bacterium]|nr:hypothetical protein [Planctomycetales bacterium]
MLRHLCPLLLVICCLGSVSYSQVTATWTGAGNGLSYSDPLNWDIGVVPVNGLNGPDTYKVIIPNGQTVEFDVIGAGHQVTQLDLGTGGVLNINSGRDLEVVDSADIAGLVTTDNSTFDGGSAASTFSGNQPRLYANAGGSLTHGGTSYTNTTHTGDIIRAEGAGSLVSLPTLGSINTDHDFGGSPISTIAARDSGLVDLSGLTTVVGGRSGDSLRFEVQSGGAIDLTSLQSIGGQRNVRFTSDGTALDLPALATIEGAVVFELATGQTLDLPSLTFYDGTGSSFEATLSPSTNGTINANALTDLDDVDITIGDGGTLSATSLETFTRGSLTLGANQTLTTGPLTNINGSAILLSGGRTLSVSATTYDDLDFRAGDVFTATGSGTTLDLSSITSMDFDHDFGGSP